MTRMPNIRADGRAWLIAGVAGLAVAQALAAAAAAFATRAVFAVLGESGAAIPTWPVLVIVLAGIATAVFHWGEKLTAEKLGQCYAAALRQELFRHIAGLPSSTVARHRSGSLSLRFVGDLTAVRAWVSQGLARLISAAIVLPSATLVLFILHPRFGAAALCVLLLCLGTITLFGPGLEPRHHHLRRQRARLAGDLAERLPHAPELKLLGRLDRELQRLGKRTGELIRASLIRQQRAALLRAIPEIFRGLTAAAILWLALQHALSAAAAAGALAALSLMVRPLRDLAGIWDRRAAWRVACKRCRTVFDIPRLNDTAAVNHRILRNPPHIRLNAVTTPQLQNIKARIPAGTRIGITGPNGSGKSSLLTLLAGLEKPLSGRILINRQAPTALSDRARRKLLALVNDRSPILAGSLRRALTMGLSPRPGDSEILIAARRFGLGELLERLSGLDGRLREGGRNLSSGEKKRLQIVRTALAEPPLMLLDEPDEALDQNGRLQLQQLLRHSRATTLTVTHDWTLLTECDEVWFMREGQLVERGAPQALMAAGGPLSEYFRPAHTA